MSQKREAGRKSEGSTEAQPRQPDRKLPVAVIGAGPVGLAAAAHLLERGLEPLVLEAGSRVGASVREWGFVRLFSPWHYLVDRAAERLLAQSGWQTPDPQSHPTGEELVEWYLEPLAALPALRSKIRFDTRVHSIARLGFDRMKSPGREEAPFELVTSTGEGERRFLASSVIDASGTWRSPNPLGASGTLAQGEREASSRIRYGIPDVLGADRSRYAGKTTLVVGAGHSAMNALIDLARLAEVEGGEALWAIRGEGEDRLADGGDDDGLPERARLAQSARSLLRSGHARLVTGFGLTSIEERSGRLQVASSDGRKLMVDEIVASTGFRPDLELTRELRLSLDPITEAPVALAPLIDPNVHSCGTVPPHGEAELSHSEVGFYLVGMKSYGRAPTFLTLTGYEQVRSIAAFLAGDLEAARKVELELPETGVCSTSLPGAAAHCCEPPGKAGGEQAGAELEVVAAGACCGG